MSEVKFAKGPWTAHKSIDAHDGFPECWQIDTEYDAVCTTQFCYAPDTAANAHLIAAAPELYGIVDEFLRLDMFMNSPARKRAVEILAKARGES